MYRYILMYQFCLHLRSSLAAPCCWCYGCQPGSYGRSLLPFSHIMLCCQGKCELSNWERHLSSVLEMRLKELCETFKSVLELILQVPLSSCFIWPCLTCLLQWCSGQWTLPGAPPVTSGAPRPPGARPHTHVAEGSDPGLDRGGGISTGPQVLLTGGHSHTRWGKILFYVWMYSIVHWS